MGRNDQLQRDLIARAGLEYEAANRAYVRAWQWLEEVDKEDVVRKQIQFRVSWQYGAGVGGYDDIQKEVETLIQPEIRTLLREAVESLGEKREAKLKELQRLCQFGQIK